jgi:alpha-mannosidase
VELDEDTGGAIVSIRTPDEQTPLLAGISNDLVSYRDSGGLWRMGFEFRGGTWKKSAQASHRPTRLQVHERDNGLEITCSAELNGETIHRLMWFSNESPVIRCRVEGRAAEGHSVTVRFTTGLSSSKLIMDTPGGVVVRPPKRIYDPTFWPLQHFAHIQDDDDGRGLAILQAMPGAVSYQSDGSLGLVALRNATREKAFGFISIPGNPASGHVRTNYAFDYALLFTQSGNWRDNDIPLIARSIANSPCHHPERPVLRSLAASTVTTDSPDVWIMAVKPASRGEGVIVRLYTPALPESPIMVFAHHFKVIGAFLCDARERDLGPLGVQDNTVRVTMQGTITTIRLLQK